LPPLGVPLEPPKPPGTPLDAPPKEKPEDPPEESSLGLADEPQASDENSGTSTANDERMARAAAALLEDLFTSP